MKKALSLIVILLAMGSNAFSEDRDYVVENGKIFRKAELTRVDLTRRKEQVAADRDAVRRMIIKFQEQDAQLLTEYNAILAAETAADSPAPIVP